MFSPDGKWIAYRSDESGRNEIWVQSFPDAGLKRQLSTNGGSSPLWSRDGQELFYIEGNRLMAVTLDTTEGLSASRPQRLTQVRGQYSAFTGYDISRDGERFLIVQEEATEPQQIRVVLDWFEELERLAPRDN